MAGPRYLVALLGLALSAPAFAEQRDDSEDEPDVVILKDTARRYTKITKDDYLTVEGQLKGFPTAVESYKVKEVVYGGSEEYRSALAFRDRGKLTAAARDFMLGLKAAAASKDKGLAWTSEYCNYGAGECLFALRYFWGYHGETQDYHSPSVYYRDALKAGPKSRFALDAWAKLVYCLVRERKLAEAEDAAKEAAGTFQKYREETGRLAPAYKELADAAEALLRLAEALLLKAKADQAAEENKPADYKPALDAFGAVLALAEDKHPEVYAEALAAQLDTMVKMKAYKAAQETAAKLLKAYREKSDPALLEILPAAHIMLGRAYFEMGRDEEARKRTLQANTNFFESRLNYLQVLVEFFGQEDFLPEALYYAGLCSEKLAMPDARRLQARDPDEKKQRVKEAQIAAHQKNGYELDGLDKAAEKWRTLVLRFSKKSKKIVPDPKAVDYTELARQGLQRLGAPAPAVEPAAK